MNRREFVKMVGGVFASVAALSPFLKNRLQPSTESPFPGFQRQEVPSESPAAGWYHNNSDHSMAFVYRDSGAITFVLPPGHSVIVDYDEDGEPTFNGLNYFLWEAEHEQA